MRFFLPKAEGVLNRICSLNAEQWTPLISRFAPNSKQDMSIQPECAKTLASSDLSEDALEEIHQYLSFLRANVQENTIPTEDELRIGLEQTIKEYNVSIPDLNLTTTNLRRVFVAPPSFSLQKKMERVADGFAAELSQVSSLVDMRPVFDGERNAVAAWIAGITLKIEYTTQAGDEDSLVLSLNKESLKKIEDALNLINTKRQIVDAKIAELAKI